MPRNRAARVSLLLSKSDALIPTSSRACSAQLMLDVASVYRSRKVDPPGGWPVKWSATLTDVAKQAVDVWSKL